MGSALISSCNFNSGVMKTQELVAEISNLPIDKRAKVVEQILQTFKQPDPEIQQAWAQETRRRLDEYKEGNVEAIPGEKYIKKCVKNTPDELSLPSGSSPRVGSTNRPL